MIHTGSASGLHLIENQWNGFHDSELNFSISVENASKIILSSRYADLSEKNSSDGVDNLGTFEEHKFKYYWNSYGIEAVYHIRSYKHKTYATAWSEIRNSGMHDVKLDFVKLLTAHDGSLTLGKGINDWVLFKNTIDKGGLITTHHFGNPEFDIRDTTAAGLEDGTFSFADEEENTVITSSYMTVLRSESTRDSILLGFLTVKSQFSSVRFTCSNDESTFISLEAICSLDNIPLNPGTSVESEKLIIDFDDSFTAIERYSKISGSLNKTDDFKNQQPPSGWCSWYFFYESVTEKNVLDNLEFICNNNIPVDYVQIDMGWEERLGDLYPNHKFPHGMKWLAEQIHSRGKKAGIWVSPFWVEPRCEIHRDHPEWLLRDKDGKLIIFNCHIDGYVIDTTIPEARQWITENFRKIKEDWGYDYVKVDFLRSVAIDKNAVYTNPATRAEALRLGMEAIREGVGSDIFILACGGHYGPTLGIANGNRTSNDIGADWNTLKITFKKNILRYWMNENWWVNDPDCLLIRGPEEGEAGNQCFQNIRKHGCGSFSEIEVRTILTLFRATGGLMFAGDDFTQLRGDKIELMNPFLNSTGKAAVPLDMFESRFPHVLHSKQEDGTDEVSIINWQDTIQDESIPLKELIKTTKENSTYKVYEYWSKQDLGVYKSDDRINLTAIEPHGCRFLIIKEME